MEYLRVAGSLDSVPVFRTDFQVLSSCLDALSMSAMMAMSYWVLPLVVLVEVVLPRVAVARRRLLRPAGVGGSPSPAQREEAGLQQEEEDRARHQHTHQARREPAPPRHRAARRGGGGGEHGGGGTTGPNDETPCRSTRHRPPRGRRAAARVGGEAQADGRRCGRRCCGGGGGAGAAPLRGFLPGPLLAQGVWGGEGWRWGCELGPLPLLCVATGQLNEHEGGRLAPRMSTTLKGRE
jgi:hypothetical protein